MNQNFIPNLVSTIIPVYNRSKMVIKAVDSVLEQTYRPIEIILVNDGSTDNTPQVLENLASQHPEVILIHRENGGAGLARETGRLAAQGEYIQYLDSDDWLVPNKFTDQVKALQDHPNCAIAYGTSMLVSENGSIIDAVSRGTGTQIDYLFPRLLLERWWHTHTPLFRREIVESAGAWPKQRPEDWDVEARMGAKKVRLIHCGSVVSCQLDHAGAERVSRQSQTAYLRDEAWFLPRLYHCALEAGMTHEDKEMQVFARWLFMRARDLGSLGEIKQANSLLHLAKIIANQSQLSLQLVSLMRKFFGWHLTSKLCSTYIQFSPTVPKGK
ncbi:glycosyltransferase family A protein [Aphanizomenon sp. UHCC 0183]|uniref:glycosyltransferase family 2 protein n=1 Tax=Aphanizomenon sp. UHCC 0183 TaxID=2590028 RepID=UPI001445062B|nr:glycosyltransferase family A protein [Aphanizomenon sp. UHCC 0183]MTJ32278.1 glycosyltransferase family 2 protein [Aphanizomenon sp. UHCC 0183]